MIETVSINNDHAGILDDALYIYSLLHRHDIKAIFKYFTDDPVAREIVEIIDKMYYGLRREPYHIDKIDNTRKKIIFAGATVSAY